MRIIWQEKETDCLRTHNIDVAVGQPTVLVELQQSPDAHSDESGTNHLWTRDALLLVLLLVSGRLAKENVEKKVSTT